MKPSILLLILLFVICVLLPTIVKVSEGMRTWKDAEGNTQYQYTNDIDSIAKSIKMDPDEDIVTHDSDLPSDFFDKVRTGPYYADDGEDESKYIARSKSFKGYKDASNNLVGENSSNVLSGSTERVMGRPYTNSSTGSSYTGVSSADVSSTGSTSTSRDSSSTGSGSDTEGRIQYIIGIIDYFGNLFRRNNEPFNTRTVSDISDNKFYDISANYELYNEDGTLKMGVHDSTDYGSLLDILEKEYRDLDKKYRESSSPIKCIADFATDIGEELCCGQTGVLQNTKYVCPSNKPTCSNFKCGSKFGTCN